MDCREQELEKFNHELFVARSYRKSLTGTGFFKTDFKLSSISVTHMQMKVTYVVQMKVTRCSVSVTESFDQNYRKLGTRN